MGAVCPQVPRPSPSHRPHTHCSLWVSFTETTSRKELTTIVPRGKAPQGGCSHSDLMGAGGSACDICLLFLVHQSSHDLSVQHHGYLGWEVQGAPSQSMPCFLSWGLFSRNSPAVFGEEGADVGVCGRFLGVCTCDMVCVCACVWGVCCISRYSLSPAPFLSAILPPCRTVILLSGCRTPQPPSFRVCSPSTATFCVQ